MIRVLVVDDEPVTADAHAEYVARIDGFELAGIAHTGSDALRHITDSVRPGGTPITLVLLDMHLPDRNGLDVCRSIRAVRLPIDVIAITAERDLPLVREALSVGVVQYLIKPFGFPAFAEKLASFAAYHARLASQGPPTTQAEVDSALSALRRSGSTALPKGIAPDTLAAITARLSLEHRAFSATELSEQNGLSRVTARRYLEHLADIGHVRRSSRHGGAGRPEIEYRWIR